jgi:hypothetical protein
MSHGLKVTLFVLGFNIIGFAEGYLMREMGLLWLLPVILATAFGAVLLSRRFVLERHTSLASAPAILGCEPARLGRQTAPRREGMENKRSKVKDTSKRLCQAVKGE